MTDFPELRAFVEALRLESTGLVLAGQNVGRHGPGALARLGNELPIVVYEHLYTRGFPPPPRAAGSHLPGKPQDASAAKVSGDLTAALEAANATSARSEIDWTLMENAPDGSVIATRHGRTRRFVAGQYVVATGVAPAPPGTRLVVHIPAGSSTAQPGFYFAYGAGFRDVNDLSPVVRIYWNVTAAGAPLLLQTLTAALNRYEIPFELKAATEAESHRRRDSAVLYLGQRHYHAALLALGPKLPEIARVLEPPTPLFTKRLADGIGLAENPPGADSFGSARSRLIAEALIAARDGERFPYPAFAERFEQAIAAAKLRRNALWLNAGSEDIYDLPRTLAEAA